MKTILLSLSTTRHSPKTVDFALKKASEEQARLVILFIIDPDIPSLILDKMMDVGFMGDTPSKQLFQSILNEYKERAKKIVQQIETKAKSQGVELKAVFAEGEFVEESLKIISQENPEMVILTRAERSNLSRFIFGSAVNTLTKKSPCPIKVIDES